MNLLEAIKLRNIKENNHDLLEKEVEVTLSLKKQRKTSF
jgi:hypothetical protein